MQIFLVRHGITEWNQKKKIQGKMDVPLAPEGRKQAREAASFFQDKKIKKTYTSDLSRARETAQIITSPLGIEPVKLRGLREIDMGNWEGLSWEEVGERFPGEQKAWIENPLKNGPGGGENISQAAERFRDTVYSISDSQTGHSPLLIVAHGLVIGTLVAWVQGKSPRFWREFSPENATITELYRENNKMGLVTFNKPV